MNNYDRQCKVIEEELRSVWPEWHVAGRLGGGAFSDVFQIYRDNLGIRVDSALKVIQVSGGSAAVIPTPSSKGQDGGKSEAGEAEIASQSDIPDALVGEIQIMEALRGAPNIVAIEDYSFKREGSTCSLFVRMELLTSLQKVLAGGDGYGALSSIREITKLGRDICTALMHCEKKGIIHRDIKPENLFVDEFGHYKAGDFGASKRMDTVHVARTMTGIGTISYMAPEIFQGRSYDHTADIYSLGLVLYQFLNKGRMPFLPAEDSYTTQDIDRANYQRLHGMPVPCLTGNYVGGERIDSRLDAVVRRACAVDPAGRFQTAKEFYDALEFRETEEKNPIPVYKKRPQGSLAPIESLQKRKQERVQPEPEIKPCVDLEPAVSIESCLQEQESGRLEREAKPSTPPLSDKPSQSRLQESDRSVLEAKTPTTLSLDKSSQSHLQESDQSETKEKPSITPQPVRSLQSLPQKEKRRPGRNNKPVIGIVLLLIIVVMALVFLQNGRKKTVKPITDSWEEIIAAGEDGTYIDKYKIGDTKELDLGEEGIINMELVAFDADELADGSGTAAMTWIAKELLNTEYAMNNEGTCKGGWPASDLRTWLLENVLPLFPETVRTNIKEVKKYSYTFSDNGSISSLDTIWIPSRLEMCGSKGVYDHKGQEYRTAFPYDRYRKKRHIGVTNSSYWWLRSASDNEDFFDGVNEDGYNWSSADAGGKRGVAVGFCLGSSRSSSNTESEEDDRVLESITDSWEEIIAAGEDGTYIDKYKIGDTKELDLGEEGIINMELVAFDADELADGSGKAHMTWIAKELLNTEHVMNEEMTNEGGWPASDLRAWLRDSILPLFPEPVRSNISEIKKYSYSYSDRSTISSKDTIWIPSYREMFGADGAYEDEGPEYIKAFPDDASRRKHYIDTSEITDWWLRSASYGNGKCFYSVLSGSAWVESAAHNRNYGIAIGFCF